MSGFDFDGLRDPDAPYPGARERAAVDARARQLRGRQRRNRLAVSATSIAAVAAVLFGVIATRDTGPEIAVPGTTVPASTTTVTSPTTVGPSVDDRFIPPTSLQNGLVTLPVTLPDGESFSMRYPPAMKIAQLGFAGGGGVVGFSGASSRPVSIGYTNVQRVYGETPPRSIFHDANGGQVALYPGNAQLGKLTFQFGPWLVQVDDANYGMTDSQLATWARNLTGTVDANGYLVLHAQSPLVVASWFDGGFGASAKGNSVELANHLYCGQPESDTAAHRRFTNGDGTRGVSWCDGDLHVVASGAPDFVDLADHRMKLSTPTSPIGPTPTFPSTTTTSTPTAPTPAGATSATFVSPSQGWVLGRGGAVFETTDAGANWQRVGSLGTSDVQGTRIRFADPSNGFAFSAYTTSTQVTHDGGATWARLNAPFSSAVELEISRGIVYAITYSPLKPGATDHYEIWSSPARHLVWTRDPRTLQIGAGPVPSEQLVFGGSNAWILDEDRTVNSGARLASNGHWVSWNPPCLDTLGPAYFTASTGSDLVAACSEHDYGGGPVTSGFYISHDGGVTFTRHDAPGWGPVASPDPNTAVLSTNGGLERTTDGGVTWHVVFTDPSANGASDLGFTTTTQGFVIFNSGEMLMTHDAGATWQRARLP